jgi:hypothetical protein
MPYYSSEYLKQKADADQFLAANRALFELLGEKLRVVDTSMAEKFQRAARDLPAGQKPLCAPWMGCAINQGQDDVFTGGATHRDKHDEPKGFNAVVPFGDYNGADLLLWPLEARVEMRRGDAIFFRGSIIAHNTLPVESGVRNSLDCFSHREVFHWVEKKRAGLLKPEHIGERKRSSLPSRRAKGVWVQPKSFYKTSK